MASSVWVFQYKKDVQAKGADKASWYVGWYDLRGERRSKSCGPGSRGHDAALKRQRRLLAELDMGVHQSRPRESWEAFKEHFEAEVLSGMEPATRQAYEGSLDVFAKHTRVRRMSDIDTLLIDRFTRKRLEDPGKKPNSTLSKATVAKDLRMLKAALTRAVDWGFLPVLPKIRPPKQAEKLVRYVTDEHFAILYEKACRAAKLPAEPDQGFTAEQWWRALIVTATMTGFRIKEILSIRREDLDFEKGTIVTRKADNKGKRDERLPLHPIVIEHLKPLGDAEFPLRWPVTRRRLWTEWQRIQKEAGIHLQCLGDHEHTDACHVYGFHDFRRAFATNNAAQLKPETLQKLMRHRSYTTTLRYINMARQVDHAIDAIAVPKVLRPSQAEPTDTAAKKPGKEDGR
jgi:integrase